MKRGLQKTEIIGNVGGEVKFGELPNGTPVLNFSVAVNESYKDREGVEKENTTWFRVNFYGKRGESLAPYIKSGLAVFVAGKVSVDSWISEGNAKAGLVLTCGNSSQDFLFLGGGQRDEDLPDVPDHDPLG